MKIKIASLVLVAILAGGIVGFYVGRDSNSSFKSEEISIATPTPTTSTAPTPVQLLCFDASNGSLRSSNVASGCLEDEESLGESDYLVSVEHPTDLNQFLKVRFLAAQAAAKREGYTLAITSGFRSYEYQASLFRAAVKKYGTETLASRWVLPPDISHHPLGLAIDVNYPNDHFSTLWLEENGFKYGLCRAYDNEWWHFEGLSAPGQLCPALISDATATYTE